MRHIVLGLLLVVAACCVYVIAHDPYETGGRKRAAVRTASEKVGDSGIENAVLPRNRLETGVRPNSNPSVVTSHAPERHSSPQMGVANRATVEAKPNRELLADLVADNEAVAQGDQSKSNAPPSLAQTMHKRLRQQLPDPDWAPYAEQQIQRYFSLQKGAFFGRFEIPVVECGSSLCEIQAAGISAGDMPGDAEIWQRVVYEMLKEPWWPQLQFKEPAIQISNSPDEGRLLFITYLIRQDAG